MTTMKARLQKTKKKDDKLKFLLAEMSILREHGKRAPNPESINKWQWEELIKISNRSARMNFYKYLFITEKKKENFKIKQEYKSQAYQEFLELKAMDENRHLRSSLFSNSFFMRINDMAVNSWRNNRLRQAIQFGIKLVLDCSYDQHMSTWEGRATAKQLMFSFSENRKHKDPFDLHICNANFNSDTMKHFERYIQNMQHTTFPLNLHEECHTDLFPKEQLVYLTPHCRDVLTDFDHNSIYIIGAIVDKSGQPPLSLAKAKQQGIRMAKLPLDKYLGWGAGGKSLTLDQMTKIMLDLKDGRNWDIALRHVPKRKIITEESNENMRATKSSANSFTRKARTESNKLDYKLNDQFGNDFIEDNQTTIAEKFKKKVKPVAQTETNKLGYNFNSERTEQISVKRDKLTEKKFAKIVEHNDKAKSTAEKRGTSRISRTVFPKDNSSK